MRRSRLPYPVGIAEVDIWDSKWVSHVRFGYEAIEDVCSYNFKSTEAG